jgi:hypothetical protein
MDTELPNYLRNTQEFLDRFDNFLLDCDGITTRKLLWFIVSYMLSSLGVLWLGHTVIEGIPKALEMLRRLVWSLSRSPIWLTARARKSSS